MKTRFGFLLALLPLSIFAGTIPGLTSKTLDNGLELRLTDLSQQDDNPDACLGRLAVENAYGSHPFAIDPLGTRDRITAATVADPQKLKTDTLTMCRRAISRARKWRRSPTAIA